MNTTLIGNVFLGHGRLIHCPRCNNNVREEVVGWTNEGGICGIPIGVLTNVGSVGARCPICQNPSPRPPDPELDKMPALMEEMKRKGKWWAKDYKPTTHYSEKMLKEFIEVGKDRNREYYNSLNWVQKKIYLGRLRRFGFKILVDFLTG